MDRRGGGKRSGVGVNSSVPSMEGVKGLYPLQPCPSGQGRGRPKLFHGVITGWRRTFLLRHTASLTLPASSSDRAPFTGRGRVDAHAPRRSSPSHLPHSVALRVATVISAFSFLGGRLRGGLLGAGRQRTRVFASWKQ